MDSECKCTPNITMNQSFTVPIKFGPNGCQAHVGNKRCQETQTLDIIKEFHRVYESKLHEIRSIGGGDTLQATIHLQQDWIRDLTQQNDMLVKVVEELEKEATDRVMMLEQKLENTAVTGDKVMQKYRDNNYSIILIQTFQRLEFLENDVCNLLEFIKRGRSDNHWNLDGLQFYTFNPSIFIHECECTTCKCASEVLTYGDAVPEKANQNIAALNLQLNDMERRLSESPKPTDLEDLNFKLHLKDEELSSVKRSMLDVRNSLVVEVAEKHDEILTLRRDMSKLEEQCRQASKQFQNQDNVIKELRNEIILLKGKPKQLDTPKSVVFELAEQDDDVLALRRNIKKLNEDKDNVIKELRNELKQLKGKRSFDAEVNFSELRGKFKELEDENRTLKDTIFLANREVEKFFEQANEYIAERDEYKRKYKDASEAMALMETQFAAEKLNLEEMGAAKEKLLQMLNNENQLFKQEIVNTRHQSESMTQAQNETIQALQEAIWEKDKVSQQMGVLPLTESTVSWVSTDESVKSTDKTRLDQRTSRISERAPSPTSYQASSPEETKSNQYSVAKMSANTQAGITGDKSVVKKKSVESETQSSASAVVTKVNYTDLPKSCSYATKFEEGCPSTSIRLEFQKLQAERDMEREMHKQEVANLKQTILELEKGHKRTQTGDLYQHSMKLFEASQEHTKIEISQQRLTILNLQDALMNCKSQLEELQQKTASDFQSYMQLEERCSLYFEKIRNLNAFINYLQDTNLHLEVTIFEYIQDVAILETRLLKYQFKFKALDESELVKQNEELKAKVETVASECDAMRRIVNEAKDLHRSFIMMQASKEELQTVAENDCERIQELQQKLGEKSSENNEYADLVQDMQKKLCWTVCQNSQLKTEITQLLEHIRDYEQNYNVKDEHAQKEIEVCKENLTDLKEKLLMMKGLLQQKIDQYSQLETEFCAQNNSLACMTDQIAENKKQYETEVCGLRCTIRELQNKLTATENTCHCLHEDYKRSQAQVHEYSKLETQLQHDFTNNLQAAQNEIATLNDYVNQLQEECCCIRQELQTKDKQIGAAKTQIAHIKTSENAQLQAAQEEVNTSRNEFNKVLQQHDLLRAKNEALCLQLSELKESAVGFEQQNKMNEHHVQKCLCELQFLRSAKIQLETKIQGYLKEIKYLRCAYSQLHENYTKVVESVSILQNDVVTYKNQNHNICVESRNVIHNVSGWLKSQAGINQQLAQKFNEDQLIIHNLKEKVTLLENQKCKCKCRLRAGTNAGNASYEKYSSLASLESDANTPSYSTLDNDSYSIDNDELVDASSQSLLRKVEHITAELHKSSEYWQSKMSDDFLVTKDN